MKEKQKFYLGAILVFGTLFTWVLLDTWNVVSVYDKRTFQILQTNIWLVLAIIITLIITPSKAD